MGGWGKGSRQWPWTLQPHLRRVQAAHRDGGSSRFTGAENPLLLETKQSVQFSRVQLFVTWVDL